MAAFSYDDFRLTFSSGRSDEEARVIAIDVTSGRHAEGTFCLPLSSDDLALDLPRGVRAGSGRQPAGPEEQVRDDAEDIGARLADALFTGAVGALFSRALARVDKRPDRGVRLSLSLGAAPKLLDVPWELLYVRPLFLASQQRTPVVRVIESDQLAEPVAIDGALRILGVVASPIGLPPLDVAAERANVEAATATMRASGTVHVDWVDPATPSALRAALRDNEVHVLHFVGHSDLTSRRVGVLFLEDDRRAPVIVDERLLANLVADQSPSLRLVVLNSCKSGRSTPEDPQAGVAATLMSLGLPAVIGMQRAFSDRAAITFAGELYTGLIDRRRPLDAAVSEARKAIYADVSPTEWATPVLFVRDPTAPLFSFGTSPPRDESARSPAGQTVTVVGSGPVAIGGNVTISGGDIAAGRDVRYPDSRSR